MHSRDINGAQFSRMEAELARVKRLPGAVDVICGQHEVYGFVVLIRYGEHHSVVVQEPGPIDALLDDDLVAAKERLFDQLAKFAEQQQH